MYANDTYKLDKLIPYVHMTATAAKVDDGAGPRCWPPLVEPRLSLHRFQASPRKREGHGAERVGQPAGSRRATAGPGAAREGGSVACMCALGVRAQAQMYHDLAVATTSPHVLRCNQTAIQALARKIDRWRCAASTGASHGRATLRHTALWDASRPRILFLGERPCGARERGRARAAGGSAAARAHARVAAAGVTAACDAAAWRRAPPAAPVRAGW